MGSHSPRAALERTAARDSIANDGHEELVLLSLRRRFRSLRRSQVKGLDFPAWLAGLPPPVCCREPNATVLQLRPYSRYASRRFKAAAMVAASAAAAAVVAAEEVLLEPGLIGCLEEACSRVE